MLLLSLTVAFGAQKRKKKKEDEEPRPQVRAVLPEPPDTVAAETGRLAFQVSPLSDKGLLSQQVRDALKALERSGHGGSIVKLRAFVAGSGDLRRVKEIVSEEFSDRKQMLPLVSTIQVGALPLIGAQVVIEGTSVEKRVVNPQGLAFLSGLPAPDASTAVEKLKHSVAEAHAGEVLRVTCFLSSLEQVATARNLLATAFPSATTNFVQTQRLGIQAQVACEAVGRLTTAPGSSSDAIALVTAPKLVMTETQLVFRDQDADIRLALQRLTKMLAAQNATPTNVFWTGVYSLTHPMADKVTAMEKEHLGHPHPGTSLLFEGLPSSDATAAVEWMAALN